MKKEDLLDIQKQYEENIKRDFNITIEQYDAVCKSENAKYKVKDFKIDSKHSLEEYLEKYGKLLSAYKLLAYRKDELWTMNKKATYWEIPNEESNLYYFAIPDQIKRNAFSSSFFAHKAIIIPIIGILSVGAVVGSLFATGVFNNLFTNKQADSLTVKGKIETKYLSNVGNFMSPGDQVAEKGSYGQGNAIFETPGYNFGEVFEVDASKDLVLNVTTSNEAFVFDKNIPFVDPFKADGSDDGWTHGVDYTLINFVLTQSRHLSITFTSTYLKTMSESSRIFELWLVDQSNGG